jgi:hypothetical protein
MIVETLVVPFELLTMVTFTVAFCPLVPLVPGHPRTMPRFKTGLLALPVKEALEALVQGSVVTVPMERTGLIPFFPSEHNPSQLSSPGIGTKYAPIASPTNPTITKNPTADVQVRYCRSSAISRALFIALLSSSGEAREGSPPLSGFSPLG